MAGYVGAQPVPEVTQTRKLVTASEGQTVFATEGYSPGYLDVYLNGVKLVNNVDFTATDGDNVTLLVGAALNDTVEIVAYNTFIVAANPSFPFYKEDGLSGSIKLITGQYLPFYNSTGTANNILMVV
jgi:hypothetical protein